MIEDVLNYPHTGHVMESPLAYLITVDTASPLNILFIVNFKVYDSGSIISQPCALLLNA